MAFATTTLVVVVWAVAAVTTVAVFVAAFRLAIRPLYLRAHYTAQGVRGLPFRPLVGNISELRAGRNLPYGTLGESFRARYGPVYVSGLPARQHHTTPPRSVRPPPSVTRCAARPRRPKRACGVGAWRCASASCFALLLWPLSRCVVLFTACRPGVARAPYRSRLTLVTSTASPRYYLFLGPTFRLQVRPTSLPTVFCDSLPAAGHGAHTALVTFAARSLTLPWSNPSCIRTATAGRRCIEGLASPGRRMDHSHVISAVCDGVSRRRRSARLATCLDRVCSCLKASYTPASVVPSLQRFDLRGCKR